jgi:O-antigen ligase
MNPLWTRLPLILLILVLPLAVAGQNIGAGVVSALLLVQVYWRRRVLDLPALWAVFRVPMVASALYLLVLAASTALNPSNPARFNFSAVGGHLYWCLLPPVILLAQPALAEKDWRRLLNVLAAATAVLGGMALSQALFGWHLVGSHIEAGPTRSQGLYSHPLSFAYVCLLLFPGGCLAAFRWPRRAAGWIIFITMGIAIVGSQSRTVEVVAAVVVLLNLLTKTRGRFRMALVAGFVAVAAVVLVTDNPVGEKFRGMLEHHDVHGDFPDDRVAFWQANLSMFLERPVLGHGENLGSAYRVRFYDALGLQDFPRKYEAHNLFLQLAVNGGIVGLGVALTWILWQLVAAWRLRPSFGGEAAWQTLWAFLAGGMTQNAFQDSAVRFTLVVVAAALWLGVRDAAAARQTPPNSAV